MLYLILDSNPAVKNYSYQLSGGQAGQDLPISEQDYRNLLNSLEHKNGFVMAVYEFTVMNVKLSEMRLNSERLLQIIDRELEKDH